MWRSAAPRAVPHLIVRRILRMRRVDQRRTGDDAEMPLADIPAKAAFVGAESVPIARQPVGLIVEHVVTLRAVGHAATAADDVAFSPRPPPTANKSLDPTAWAFLFLSEFSVIRHIISPVESSPAHAAGQLYRSGN